MAKIWTDEMIDLVTTYLRNGLTTTQIAKKMNVSLDAIGAMIRRYGLGEHKLQKPSTSKFLDNLNLDLEDLDDEHFKQAKEDAKLRWKIKKTTIKKSKKKKDFKMGVLWSDVHIPHENKPACKAVIKLMDDIKFDICAIMGDFQDLGCISHWNRNRHRTLEMKRLKTDYIEGNALLDQIDSRLPKGAEKYFLEGNHEKWADDLLQEMPALEGMIEPKTMLKLDERGYKYSKYNELVKIGRLYLTHGIYAGANPIKKHIDTLKVNIAFCHTHTLGMQLFSSPAREIAFAGYNLGCLCDLAPDYMKNQPNGWAHGFGIGYFYPNGYYDVLPIRIVNGKFIYNNKIYDGNV